MEGNQSIKPSAFELTLVFTVHHRSVKLGSQRTPPQASRPGLTHFGLSSITATSILSLSKRLLFDPNLFWALASLVVVADVALTQLIIRFVPCMKSSLLPCPTPHQTYVSDTEIDWETYMHQIKMYLDGERDYSAISGPTGPLV